MKKLYLKLIIIIQFVFFQNVFAEESQNPNLKLSITASSEKTKRLKELSKRLSDVRNETLKNREKLLALQDELGLNGTDSSLLSVDLIKKKSDLSVKILKAEFFLNEVLIVDYIHPVLFSRFSDIPVFSGVLPKGTYELRASVTFGELIHGEDFNLAQGQKIVEGNFKVSLDKSHVKKNLVFLKSGENFKLELE